MKYAFILAAFWLISRSLTAADKPAPNFLIILTDDQSWVGTSLRMNPDIAGSSSDYIRTPNMDALLRSGMRFSDGYASGAWCTPTRRCIQSGLSTSRHIYSQTTDGGEVLVRTGHSMPRALKAADPAYVCAHFGKWHLQYESVTPEALGYDVCDGNTTNEDGEMPRNLAAAKRSDYKAALRQGAFKLVKFYGGAGDGQVELYDLAQDIGETQNLAAEKSEIAARLTQALDRYLERVGGLRQHSEATGKKRKRVKDEL